MAHYINVRPLLQKLVCELEALPPRAWHPHPGIRTHRLVASLQINKEPFDVTLRDDATWLTLTYRPSVRGDGEYLSDGYCCAEGCGSIRLDRDEYRGLQKRVKALWDMRWASYRQQEESEEAMSQNRIEAIFGDDRTGCEE